MLLQILAVALTPVVLAEASRAASLSDGYTLSAIYGFVCSASGAGSGSLSERSPGCADVVQSGSFTVSASAQATYDTLRPPVPGAGRADPE